MIAVFKGGLTLDDAQDCASREVAAGRAVVVPAGKFRLRNAGNQPAQFSGVFFNLPIGGADPLMDDGAEPAPACAGVSAAAVVPSGVSAANAARGVITAGKYDGADYSGTVAHSLEAGKDMFVGSYVLEPGFSTGWIVHTDELVILTSGTLAIYEAHHGECKKVEEYGAGQAWAHKPHRHMGVNEGLNRPWRASSGSTWGTATRCRSSGAIPTTSTSRNCPRRSAPGFARPKRSSGPGAVCGPPGLGVLVEALREVKSFEDELDG